uniref:Solute carrier family 2, facilitated glucose transporter member 5 n=1 Tax=Ciona savignyi TaxID=51511 RepID=H2ZMW0_CIOSA
NNKLHDSIYPQKLTWWVMWSLVVTVWAGTFQYGYSLGSVNAAAIPIRTSIEEYHMHRYNTTLTEDQFNVIWVSIVASFPVGGLFGAALVNPLRKYDCVKSMSFLHATTIIGSILFIISKAINSFEVIIAGRLIFGMVSSAAGVGLLPMYVVEVSPRHLRGVFGSLISLFIAVGIFVANTLGLKQVLGNSNLWPLFLSLTCVPSIVFLLLCYFMPRSPRYLFIHFGNAERTERLLKKLRDTNDVSDEINDLKQELIEMNRTPPVSIWQVLSSAQLRRQLTAALVLTSAQQLTGMNGVQIYLNRLYQLSGIEEHIIPYCSIATSGMLVVATISVTFIADKKGRRFYFILGFVIESVSLLVLCITALNQHRAQWIPYIAIMCALCFIIGFAIGPGPITLTCIAESFPQRSRSPALTIASFSLWFSFTLIVVVWSYIQEAIGGYAYLVFSFLALLAALYVYFSVPETKNRSFIEIERSYQQL